MVSFSERLELTRRQRGHVGHVGNAGDVVEVAQDRRCHRVGCDEAVVAETLDEVCQHGLPVVETNGDEPPICLDQRQLTGVRLPTQ